MKSFHIAEYENGTHNNHEPKRDRKLLLNKKELRKIQDNIKEKGLTIVPLRIFINDSGFVKFDIGIAKGKKIKDKRQSIKDKDLIRSEERNLKI